MQIKRATSIYFSPTGTTEKVASRLASSISNALSLPCESYDFTLPTARTGFPSLSCDDLVVFAVPTYAGRVPNVLLKYLETIAGNGALAVAAVTFGNRNFDNSLIELRDILENKGFHTIAACAVSCEHSFSYTLGQGRPDADDLQELGEFAAKVAALLAGGANAFAPIEVPGIPETYGGYYKPQDRNGVHIDIRKVTPKVSEKCTSCGLCAHVCPMGSIDSSDVTKMNGICIKCGACCKKCPASARYFDDEGYLYHKTELEEMYERRAANSFFISK